MIANLSEEVRIASRSEETMIVQPPMIVVVAEKEMALQRDLSRAETIANHSQAINADHPMIADKAEATIVSKNETKIVVDQDHVLTLNPEMDTIKDHLQIAIRKITVVEELALTTGNLSHLATMMLMESRRLAFRTGNFPRRRSLLQDKLKMTA